MIERKEYKGRKLRRLKQVDGAHGSGDYLKRINGPRGEYRRTGCQVISKK